MAPTTFAPAIPNGQADFAPVLPKPILFGVDSYLKMIEHGILKDYERLELIDGVIVQKMPHTAEHDSTISRIQRRLQKLLDDNWIVRVQSSIKLDKSVPEPDLAVVPAPEELYDHQQPTAKQTRLVIEVSGSTLAYDREEKRRVYASNGVAEYWIVNLVEQTVEVSTSPRGGKKPLYRTVKVYATADAVPVVIDKQDFGSLLVREMFPR